MHNTMLGLFNLGGGEILLILFMLMFQAAGVGAVVLIVVWLAARQNKPPRPVPPVQPIPPLPPPTRTCPRCGTPLPTDAPEGLCPRCVLGVGLATHTEAPGDFGPHGARTLQPPPEPAEITKHFPQLEVLECLGRGGMGMVYKARQPKLNRLVALKILAPEKGADPKFAERFLREAQALARLSHPNIVTVHDFGEADGLYYLLMEYVDGVTLRQLLQGQKIAPEQALQIVPKICEALQFAHERGIVHRDIKPENVLLDKQGRVKIADFGIAKLVGAEAVRPSLTEDKSVIGTPHYMAPEQVEKPQTVDHRADIYSLGVVFYEMLTGELPLGNFQPPSRKVQVDVRLDEVVLHALEKEPERRYQHASEVKTDLEAIAATAATSED
jgi:serine/threonine protein kinase